MHRDHIQIELLKLSGGETVLRLSEPQSGLALERKLDAKQSVRDQKEKLLKVFEAALTREELSLA